MQRILHICCLIVSLLSYDVILTNSQSTESIGVGIFMHDAVTKTGARCLDGTPGAYYISNSSTNGITVDQTKFFIYFQGGGWCSGIHHSNGKGFDSCYARRNETGPTSLGSSTNYTASYNLGDQFGMERNRTRNPTFWNWTHVFIRYCDGGSFSGDRNDVIYDENGLNPMYFRGKRIMDAVIDSLEVNNGLLSNASAVVVSGGSAGGLSSILHTNYIVSRLNEVIQHSSDVSNVSRIHKTRNIDEIMFATLPNVGYFLEYNGYNGNANYSNGLRWIYNEMNVSSSISGVFETDNDAESGVCGELDSPTECMFAQNIAGHIQVPVFLFNSQYDAWQVDNILGDAGNATLINEYGKNFTNIVINMFLNNNGGSGSNGIMYGAFIDSCLYHDGSSNTYWYDVKIDGDNGSMAFYKFYRYLSELKYGEKYKDGGRRKKDRNVNDNFEFFWYQNVSYPCKSCCPS